MSTEMAGKGCLPASAIARFAKIIIEKDTGKILGFHILESYATILIQEVISAMSSVETVMPIFRGLHIHPALSEVIQATLQNLSQS